MKKRLLLGGLLVALLVFAGFFVPIDEYSIPSNCPGAGKPTTIRLHYILGDRMEDVITPYVEPPPNVDCTAPAKYVLYLL